MVFAHWPGSAIDQGVSPLYSYQKVYDTVRSSFIAAQQTHFKMVSRSKVVFMGHGYGAGLLFALGNDFFDANGSRAPGLEWGREGKLFVPLAPGCVF